MGREKQFDVQDALEKALECFWAQGYEATSMSSLLGEMGINRGSFYDTFESKKGVFLEALRRYDQKYRRDWLHGIKREVSPRAAILKLFETVLEEAMGDRGSLGCFLVNTALEMANRDPEIREIVDHSFADTRAFFSEMVKQGRKRGEIAGGQEPDQLARALMALLLGMRVLAKTSADPDDLRDLLGQVERLLDG
ncbi:MAG TPA: TetR/AcrR family transcriptional regulator [Planctomycetes bacterium]|nr:TetR/AcrR family transcriptional regulator [Planctomycetota bacterium]